MNEETEDSEVMSVLKFCPHGREYRESEVSISPNPTEPQIGIISYYNYLIHFY